MEFKNGDKVRCLTMPPHYGDRLEVGKIYTVRITGAPPSIGWLRIAENNERNSYEMSCFSLVPRTKNLPKDPL